MDRGSPAAIGFIVLVYVAVATVASRIGLRLLAQNAKSKTRAGLRDGLVCVGVVGICAIAVFGLILGLHPWLVPTN